MGEKNWNREWEWAVEGVWVDTGEDGRFCCHVYVVSVFEDPPPLRV